MSEREFQEKLEVEQKARERVAIQTVITAKKHELLQPNKTQPQV